MDGVIYKAGLICLVDCGLTEELDAIYEQGKERERAREGERAQERDRERECREGVSTESQVEVRERARGRCSLCQSWQIDQLPVRCDEEGRRGRRGRLKDPWQAGKRRRKRRRTLRKSVGGNALVDGRSQRTLFWRWRISYLDR